ncbi:TetR/AcrR family transcriptional regulator [Natronospirillum operosum]|nr:TetR/AcrR family transcriptional regulator [Natronospirillum operosum]
MKTSRYELLLIAFRLFLKKGYEQTSMRNLVAASGLSKGAFHHYFQRKGDLLDACIEHFFSRFLPHVEDASHSHFAELVEDSAQQYLALLRELHRLDIPPPAYQRFVWSLLPDHAAEFEQRQELIANRLVQLAEQDLADGILQTPNSAQSLALQAMAIIEGLGILASASPNTAFSTLEAQFRQGISDYLANLRS